MSMVPIFFVKRSFVRGMQRPVQGVCCVSVVCGCMGGVFELFMEPDCRGL